MKTLNVMLDEGAKMPERAHPDDAGMDLFCVTGGCVTAHGRHFFDTGVHVQIPSGYVGYIKSKSGLMKNHGLRTDGTIDAGFLGSIGVVIFNESDKAYIFHRGDKLAQLVIEPIETPEPVLVDHMDDTERGDGGFGSTGK